MAENDEKSKYNEAGLQIERLHTSWTKCNAHARSGNLIAWKWELDIVWRELRADVERTSKKEKIIEENDMLKEAIANARTISQFYEALNNRHEFLKKLQDDVGKGAIWEDPFSDDFD